MKRFSFTCMFLFAGALSVFAQLDQVTLPNVTSSELSGLKPTTGTMVYNTTEDAIYYYGNNGWFALSGECVPKPVSPMVDSAFVSNGQLFVYFSPVNSLLNYLVEDGGTKLLGTVNTSPAVFPVSDAPRSVTVRASSKCGNSGPLQLFQVEVKGGQ